VLTNPDLLLDSHTSDVHNPISFGLVLVAEDNAVNRLVAGGVLENLGYQVEFAHDGLEAVDAMTRSRDRFVAVLMDCQMPRLDGFEATRVIRKMEPSGAHMPVIAMTASVLPGDRERCFEAGMDDFLTKPIDVGLLESTLARWVRGEASTTVGGASHAKPQEVVSEEDPTGLLDLDRIRMLHGLKPGDQSFFEKFSETFVARVAGDVAAIEATIRDGDHPRLAMAAHSLKGSAQNLGAAEVGRACQALEDAGDRHDITDAPGLLLELRRQVDLTVLALREQPA
jgi:CheY-like chemotaxis protein/HPt (histidine-containing phosphotransfer) domain-containing protein